MLSARAAESHVEREKAGLVLRTLSRVVRREVIFLPNVVMVVFEALNDVYAETRERYI